MEHCSGIGAGRHALELLGLRPGGHVATEVDEAAIKVMKSCWPAVSTLGDLRELTEEKLLEGTIRMNDTRHGLEIAGKPGQDLSGANVSGKNLSSRQKLTYKIVV